MGNLDKRSVEKWESARLNSATYLDYYYRLLNKAINVFEWKNLPDDIDVRFLEFNLIVNGCMVFFKDEVLGYRALKTTYGGNLNVYEIPEHRYAFAVNGYNKQLTNENSVLVWNNYMRMPSISSIELFARRLYELERSIDVNIKAQKTPVLIKCTEAQRLTLKNLYMQYDGNEPFIFADKNLDIGGVTAINTNAPFVADRLQIQKKEIWNEALTFLGVESVNSNKKERMITDEVSTDLGDAESQRYIGLNARRQGVEKINKMFNLNITVDFRSNNTSIDTSPDGKEEKEDIEEGNENE